MLYKTLINAYRYNWVNDKKLIAVSRLPAEKNFLTRPYLSIENLNKFKFLQLCQLKDIIAFGIFFFIAAQIYKKFPINGEKILKIC